VIWGHQSNLSASNVGNWYKSTNAQLNVSSKYKESQEVVLGKNMILEDK
jgi:hypothetical protein